MFKQKLISITQTVNQALEDRYPQSTIRELEKEIEKTSKIITDIEGKIKNKLENNTEYPPEFFDTMIPLIDNETTVKTKHTELIKSRDIKISKLIQTFNINDPKENLDLFVNTMQRQIDKTQSIKFKRAKIDMVYDAIKKLHTLNSTEEKVTLVLKAIDQFRDETKAKKTSESEPESDSTKINLILELQEKVKTYLTNPSAPRKIERTATQKILKFSNSSDDFLVDQRPSISKQESTNTLVKKARRKSSETLNNVLTKTLSNEIDVPTDIIGQKLKKILILEEIQNLKNLDTKEKIQAILRSAFDRIDNEFISAINNVRPTVINIENNVNVQLTTNSGTTYTLGNKIGGGSNGTIWEVTQEDSTEELVAKKVYVGLFGMDSGMGVQTSEQAFNELNMIHELGIIQNSKPHYITYKDFFIVINNANESVELVSIMEKLPKTLDKLCVEIANAPLQTRLQETLRMIQSCAIALIDPPNIMHGDIKLANMGLDSDGTVKLFDFGSTHFEGAPFEGSKFFRAPESLLENPTSPAPTENTLTRAFRRVSHTLTRSNSTTVQNGQKLDIFAIGVSAWQLLTGEKEGVIQLFPNEPKDETATIDPSEISFNTAQLDTAFNHLKLEGLTDEQKDFFKSLAHPNPELRPTYENIMAFANAQLNDLPS